MESRIVSDWSMAPLMMLGVLSMALNVFSGTTIVEEPFVGWLLAFVLLLAWLAIAARLGVRRLEPRWLAVVSGAMVACTPLMGLLPSNRCIIFGSCVF